MENGRNREEFVAFELTTTFQGQIWFITKTYLRLTNYVTDTLKYNIKSIPKQSSPGVPRKGLERRSAPDQHPEAKASATLQPSGRRIVSVAAGSAI